MKKTVIKDGKAQRVNEVVAERMVRSEGYKYCPKYVYKEQNKPTKKENSK